MGFSAVYCTACYLLLFVPAMAASTLQSRARYCKGRKCIFSLFIDTFRQHCKIVVIHPQQPLCHCRAPCQGCNAADADLWYTLPDVLDEIVATQCAARMVIGAFTASSFFQNQPLKLLADHTVPRGGIQRTQDLSLNFCILPSFIVWLLPTKILILPIRSRVKLQPYRLDLPDLYRLGGKKGSYPPVHHNCFFRGRHSFCCHPSYVP